MGFRSPCYPKQQDYVRIPMIEDLPDEPHGIIRFLLSYSQ